MRKLRSSSSAGSWIIFCRSLSACWLRRGLLLAGAWPAGSRASRAAGQHLLGGVAGAAAHHLAHPVQHLLQVLALDRSRVAIGLGCMLLLLGRLRLLRLPGQLVQILVHAPLQLFHQPLELLRRWPLGQAPP